jgi:hypothetical protein
MGTYIFKLAKKGFGLLGKPDKSVGTLTVKPSGKKTETKHILKIEKNLLPIKELNLKMK